MYRRILVAVDGSPAATRALDEAIRLATEDGVSLCLIHVVEMPYVVDGETVDFTTLAEERAELGRRLLAEASARVRRAGIELEVVLTSTDGGTVGAAIVAEAKQWSADLIVLGTHGHGLVHRLLGSTVEDLVRATPVPVLLVRGE